MRKMSSDYRIFLTKSDVLRLKPLDEFEIIELMAKNTRVLYRLPSK